MTPALLAIFAHPDDEGSCGGSLARYAAAGCRVYVACATRGDGVDAKISDPSLATRATLGEVRSAELACACERLGINPPIFLGYQDGEVDKVPLEDAARTVARLIRELRPDVVMTHDPEGGMAITTTSPSTPLPRAGLSWRVRRVLIWGCRSSRPLNCITPPSRAAFWSRCRSFAIGGPISAASS